MINWNGGSIDMKRVNVGVLLVAVGALLFGTAKQSGAGPSEYSRPDGILRMKHSASSLESISRSPCGSTGCRRERSPKGMSTSVTCRRAGMTCTRSRPSRASDSWQWHAGCAAGRNLVVLGLLQPSATSFCSRSGGSTRRRKTNLESRNPKQGSKGLTTESLKRLGADRFDYFGF